MDKYRIISSPPFPVCIIESLSWQRQCISYSQKSNFGERIGDISFIAMAKMLLYATYNNEGT